METNAKEIDKKDSGATSKENAEKSPTVPALAYLDDMMERIKNKKQPPAISTGFGELDRSLGGGLYSGLYVIGAISSLGKTTFTCQIANQIAAQGKDVLIFSLEMDREELIAKDISRISGIMSLCGSIPGQEALSTRQILNGNNVSPMLASAFDIYKKIAGHIFIYEGMGNVNADTIRTKVNQFVSETRRIPIVIVDYLQIIAPFSAQYSTDKQNIDKTVLELKRISRDQGIPIVAISSLNRLNYKEVVSMSAFKESGGIEYSADVLLGLQLEGMGEEKFDVDAAKQKSPREVELKVLKNRNGSVGNTIHFAYYPKFNLFSEKKTSFKVIPIFDKDEVKTGTAVLAKLVADHFAIEQLSMEDVLPA